MRKVFKGVAIIFAIFVIYVTIDCIRLKNTKFETKPFISFKFQEYENQKKYIGLGYSIKYYYEKKINGNEKEKESIYGAEFRLFDKILIWAWVE